MALLATLWIGKELGQIELISAKSLIRHGDELIIYGYEKIDNIPNGVVFKDANEVFPCNKIIRHKKTGSPALHSDLFRYALIEKTGAIWVDLDILALKPFKFPSEWVFGYEQEGYINGAVLHFPKNSKTLKKLLEIKPETKGMPPNLQGFKKVKYALRNWMQGGLSIDLWPWGSIGPSAITEYLYIYDEVKHALPRSAFYAVGLDEVEKFVKPGALSMADIPKDAWALHLWGKELRNVLREKYENRIPDGSFLQNFM